MPRSSHRRGRYMRALCENIKAIAQIVTERMHVPEGCKPRDELKPGSSSLHLKDIAARALLAAQSPVHAHLTSLHDDECKLLERFRPTSFPPKYHRRQPRKGNGANRSPSKRQTREGLRIAKGECHEIHCTGEYRPCAGIHRSGGTGSTGTTARPGLAGAFAPNPELA
jgi:hypothetical protein